MNKIKNIVLIGAGNVATQLAYAFENAGFKIKQVYSRSVESAEKLANDISTDFTIDTKAIMPDADLYVISVTDAAVELLAMELFFKNKLVVHTSGSLSIDVIQQMSANYGVFYPLQTFSKTRKADFKSIPICIEACSEGNEKLLMDLGGSISNNVLRVKTDERKILHLAAVFACNFPNFMYTIAEKILDNNKLDFNLLKPLIKETAAKVQTIDPINTQTGPAKRGDLKIMNRHLELLKDSSGFKDIYKLISSEIQKIQ